MSEAANTPREDFLNPHERDAAIDAASDRVGLLAAQIHVLHAELVAAVGEFDALDSLGGSGYKSLNQWLSVRTKLTPGDSKQVVAVLRQRDRIPMLMEDASQGAVSLSLLAAAARVATPENEQTLTEIVRTCVPSQALRVMAKYRELRDEQTGSGANTGGDGDPEYWLRQWIDSQGRGRIDAALDGATAELLKQALKAARAASERDAGAKRPCNDKANRDATSSGQTGPAPGSDADRNARGQDPLNLDDARRRRDPNEAIRRLAGLMLDESHRSGLSAPNGEKFSVLVHCDLATLATALGLRLNNALPVRLGSEAFIVATGQHLTDTELAQICCDANIQVLVEQNGVPLWMSNESRLFNRHQRRAMTRRNGAGCAFPGCDQTRFLDAHHVHQAADGGPTTLDNGVLLCGWHHRSIHRNGWVVTHDGVQSFTFWDSASPNARCLGTTSSAVGQAHGPPPGDFRLPLISEAPEPPPRLTPDSPRSIAGGEAMTSWALDVYLGNLLTAA